jgi:hypothetical protein
MQAKGLRDSCLGHTGDSMHDLYDWVKGDVEFRRKKTEEYGIGFNLPSVVPNAPKIAQRRKAARAA